MDTYIHFLNNNTEVVLSVVFSGDDLYILSSYCSTQGVSNGYPSNYGTNKVQLTQLRLASLLLPAETLTCLYQRSAQKRKKYKSSQWLRS